jgi:hypothetical protein
VISATTHHETVGATSGRGRFPSRMHLIGVRVGPSGVLDMTTNGKIRVPVGNHSPAPSILNCFIGLYANPSLTMTLLVYGLGIVLR